MSDTVLYVISGVCIAAGIYLIVGCVYIGLPSPLTGRRPRRCSAPADPADPKGTA